MGHNYSDRKLRGLVADRAPAERHLAGWRSVNGKLVPLSTVEGVLARGGTLNGRCASDECRRYVRMDLQWWARHGLGEVSIGVAQRAYTCARLGCALSWQPEVYPAGVPLQFYVGEAVRLAVKCRKCGAGREFTAEEVIAGLESAETGDGNTGINDVAHRLRGKCRACRYPGWMVDVVRSPVGPGGLPAASRDD